MIFKYIILILSLLLFVPQCSPFTPLKQDLLNISPTWKKKSPQYSPQYSTKRSTTSSPTTYDHRLSSTINCNHFDTCSGCTTPNPLTVPVLSSSSLFWSTPSIAKHLKPGVDWEIVEPERSKGWRTQAKLATKQINLWKGGVEFGLYKTRTHIVEVS